MYCFRPAASTPVAWSFDEAPAEIETSFQAGGIARDLIRSSFSSSTMRFRRAST